MSAYVQESLFSVRLGGRSAACGAAFLRASRGPAGFCQPAGEAGTPCRGPEGVRGDPGGQDAAARRDPLSPRRGVPPRRAHGGGPEGVRGPHQGPSAVALRRLRAPQPRAPAHGRDAREGADRPRPRRRVRHDPRDGALLARRDAGGAEEREGRHRLVPEGHGSGADERRGAPLAPPRRLAPLRLPGHVRPPPGAGHLPRPRPGRRSPPRGGGPVLRGHDELPRGAAQGGVAALPPPRGPFPRLGPREGMRHLRGVVELP